MKLITTPLEGLFVASPSVRSDSRGVFFRAFCESEFATVLGCRRIKQANISVTKDVGAVRGMHYQRPPNSEMKIVQCVAGSVFDVAVDLRRGSKTFLQWYGLELSPKNPQILLIPEGFAHGFQVLEKESMLLYFHTANYSPGLEAAVRFDDPAIGIKWPLAVSTISVRDAAHSLIDSTFEGVDA